MSKALRFLASMGVVSLLSGQASAQWVSQDIHLRAGWNSVYLEVDPYPSRCDLLLAGQPIRSVWTWDPNLSPVQFIQNPSELIPETPAFRVFYPPGQPKSFLTNLFTLNAGKAYLIEASAETDLTLTGRALLTEQSWLPNSYNLVGFYVDPNSPATLGAWFAGSPAHTPLDVWRLNDSGVWEQVGNPNVAPIQSGVAYWVYSNGSSTFQGPVRIQIPTGFVLDFPRLLTSQSLTLDDLRVGARQVTVGIIPSEPAPTVVPEDPSSEVFQLAGDVPLSYRSLIQGGTGYFNYVPLPATVDFAAGQTAARDLELTVDRMQMVPAPPEAVHQSLLVVTNGAGFRRYVGVLAEGPNNPGKYNRNKGGAPASPQAGLWVGAVELSKVSEPNISPVVLTETPSHFNFRFLCHVDRDGVVRLLNSVNLYWREGTTTTDPVSGQTTIIEPGRYILVTPTAPQALLNEIGNTIKPGALRDGRPFSSRVTSLMYPLHDANGNPETPQMTLNGTFGTPGSTLSITMVEENTDPVNPFHHQYHPEHRYPKPGETVYPSSDFTIAREVTLTFLAADPAGGQTAGLGDSEVVGTYREVLTGLRRVGGSVPPVVTEGAFRLSRASTVDQLNDGM